MDADSTKLSHDSVLVLTIVCTGPTAQLPITHSVKPRTTTTPTHMGAIHHVCPPAHAGGGVGGVGEMLISSRVEKNKTREELHQQLKVTKVAMIQKSRLGRGKGKFG